jgi:hypothetical protein
MPCIFYINKNVHGLHVMIGTAFLTVGLWRVLAYHLTNNHHLGLKAGILYWHFVDVVWLFLFFSIFNRSYFFFSRFYFITFKWMDLNNRRANYSYYTPDLKSATTRKVVGRLKG